MNFGPQHPAAHGVLRLVIEIDGEIIEKVDAHIGLLHRGTEKLLEVKNYLQGLPYVDRLDYVSVMAQEHCFSLAVEDLMGIHVPYKAKLLRILFCELTRILNHLLAITTHALDVGALTPFLWGFDLRETLMEYYERACGSRLHANYIRPGGVSCDVGIELINDIDIFCKQFGKRVDEIEEVLSKNRIWLYRLIDIGKVDINQALDYGFTGPMLRGSGKVWDLRYMDNYENYLNYLDSYIPIGINGDCFDRYSIRLHEMRNSNNIMCNVLKDIKVFL